MSEYQRILVVIDPERETQPALERAAFLAKKNGGQLTLTLNIFDFSYEMTSLLSAEDRENLRNGLIKQRQTQLEALAVPLREQGVQVDTSVNWHNRPFESIIEQALRSESNLIIKSTHQHDKLKSVIFTPTDWHLLRKAPMPVLLVKADEWPTDGRILVAVNVAAEDDDHLNLNRKLLRKAKALAAKINAEIHLVNGYPGTPVNIAIELPDFDAHAYNESLKSHHQDKVAELAAEFEIPADRCHVLEGLPEDVIPELAEELDTELVMIGTIGRTGLSAALIGNTAEHVIDQIQCDLLADKPDDFESPIKI
ncbi:universal stress protein UspE [Ferrimonas marina]|uniref:Universal stress protein E n=1 Tax=Ferrimonas marina TaxID=299255 RepID=A0A1M5NC42_9GAMM|nr:universal stress protein UspE [Ferrimonas marina]SHG87067.1 universal stress protein E [Ferrimonas marina]